jgi:hypothetical protein
MSDPLEQWLCSPPYSRSTAEIRPDAASRESEFATQYDSAYDSGKDRAKVVEEYSTFIASLVPAQLWPIENAPYRRRIFRELDFEQSGYTALMRHSAARRPEFVLALLDHGADPRPRSPTNRTALHYALLPKTRLAAAYPDNTLVASNSPFDYDAMCELARCRGGPDLGDAEIFEICAAAIEHVSPSELSKLRVVKGLSWVYSAAEVEGMKQRAF